MIVLAIETSCDESAVAIMDDKKNILANIIKSQINIHEKYGGVVPELAARSHAEIIDKLILIALKEADLNFKDIDIFAATCGPGLIGGVIIGMMAAKTLASIHRKPFLAINHGSAGGFAAGCGGALRARRPPGSCAFWNFRLKTVPEHSFFSK